MKETLNPLVEVKIQELSKRLVEHRKKHGSRCHPTREIWESALDLCEQASLSRVAQGIGVSVNGLQKWKNAARHSTAKVGKSRQPQFLEVRALESAVTFPTSSTSSRNLLTGSSISREVALLRSDGSCLKITDLGAHGIDLRVLIQGFMTSPSMTSTPTQTQERGAK